MLLLWPMSVSAAGPASAAPAETSPAPAETSPAPASEAAIDTAPASDLRSAAEAATEARKADPTAANWHAEGDIYEKLGDYQAAADAYAGEIDALPKDAEAARQAARGDLQRVRDQARGRVADEPASTHRAEFDKEWAAPAPKKAKPKPKAKPAPPEPPRDRIVRKWYFWVTIAAIAASAAAVTGIAIKASRDERRDALDLMRDDGNGLQGPALFRF